MAARTVFALLALFMAHAAASSALSSNVTELSARDQFSTQALEFTYPSASIYSTSAAGVTYSMDLNTNPILATLPDPGLSGKIDIFQPCSLKIPHVHPRASKFSYVVSGTLQVGIAEEDTGRVMDYNVSTGSAIVVPQGLLHYMKNNNCTNTLTMLTVFNNVDAGELTMLDKILRFPDAAVLAASGLNQTMLNAFRANLPLGPGDLRVDTACQAACNIPTTSAETPAVAVSTAG